MKFIFVVTNSQRKSLVFVSDQLEVYSLEKAIQFTREGKVEGAHVVTRNGTAYIRTNPKVAKKDEFDTLSMTVGNLLLFAQGTHVTLPSPSLNAFLKTYRDQLDKNGQLIKPVGQPEVLLANVREKLQQHRSIIFDAAKKFDIDPYLLGAILVDEIARLLPFEPIVDRLILSTLGRNTSFGVAQVKTDTANAIIKLGLYNPNPKDPKLPFSELDKAAREHLATYLIEPKHGIFFAAAVINDIINSWKPIAGNKLTSAVIATIYSKGGNPHPNPESNDRGDQIANEFYQLAKKILK